MNEVQCDCCNETFGTESALLEHFKASHAEEWKKRRPLADKKARLEEVQAIRDIVQAAFMREQQAGPTEARVALSWVLGRCRQRIAALGGKP